MILDNELGKYTFFSLNYSHGGILRVSLGLFSHVVW